MRHVMSSGLVVCSLALFVGAGIAQAEDIQGTIVATRMIFEDSQLTGDVTCQVVGAPCIQFGADDIELKLNGFTMTGTADANTGCGGTTVGNESGIDTNLRHGVEIEGPGLVQQFRFSGIHVVGSTNSEVERVTISTNCFAGISLFGSSNNDINKNVMVRNGNVNAGCGGIELVGLTVGGVFVGGSNNNRVKNNLIGANGYSNSTENDFGILIGAGSNNLIEKNSVVGNTVGIDIGPGPAVAPNVGNVIVKNVALGNPPIQVSNSFPATAALRADIRNRSAAGANKFKKNVCLTYIGPAPSLCPNLSNGSDDDDDDDDVRDHDDKDDGDKD